MVLLVFSMFGLTSPSQFLSADTFLSLVIMGHETDEVNKLMGLERLWMGEALESC